MLPTSVVPATMAAGAEMGASPMRAAATAAKKVRTNSIASEGVADGSGSSRRRLSGWSKLTHDVVVQCLCAVSALAPRAASVRTFVTDWAAQ